MSYFWILDKHWNVDLWWDIMVSGSILLVFRWYIKRIGIQKWYTLRMEAANTWLEGIFVLALISIQATSKCIVLQFLLRILLIWVTSLMLHMMVLNVQKPIKRKREAITIDIRKRFWWFGWQHCYKQSLKEVRIYIFLNWVKAATRRGNQSLTHMQIHVLLELHGKLWSILVCSAMCIHALTVTNLDRKSVV